MALDIYVQPTPNPNALKFILDTPVKLEGKSTYFDPSECKHNKLASALFALTGVNQVHFFQNVVTITKNLETDWDKLESDIRDCLELEIGMHRPDYQDPNPEKERRANLPPEILKIEEILDKTIRPGLQGDGGDLNIISLEDNVLIVKYEGACGTCPSSTTGTLQAIQSILQEQYDPEIQVFAQPY